MHLFLLLACIALCGCVIPGQSAYVNDPFTGGVDSSTSRLLNISMPGGLQLYPSHSRLGGGARIEGLETWRGHVDESVCARQLYDRLVQAGWQMRMSQTAGSRAIYVFEKNDTMAAITFQAQGMLTILHIWGGARLGDGAAFMKSHENEPLVSLPGEEYAPATGTEERWGVEEKEL